MYVIQMAAVLGKYPEIILGFPCFFNDAYSVQTSARVPFRAPVLPFREPEALDTIPV